MFCSLIRLLLICTICSGYALELKLFLGAVFHSRYVLSPKRFQVFKICSRYIWLPTRFIPIHFVPITFSSRYVSSPRICFVQYVLFVHIPISLSLYIYGAIAFSSGAYFRVPFRAALLAGILKIVKFRCGSGMTHCHNQLAADFSGRLNYTRNY